MEPRTLPTDWATHFDMLDPGYLDDPYSMWAAMREHCPVARSDLYGGAVMPVRHADISRIAHDTETFSSRALEATGVIPAPGRELKIPPISSDPPLHNVQRRLLLPLFSRARIAELEEMTREKAVELLASLAGRSRIDAADEYARHLPVAVIAHMLGVPEDDHPRFEHWVVMLLKEGPTDQAVRVQAIREISAYFVDLLATQRTHGGEGIVAHMLEAGEEVSGLGDDDLVGMCLLLLVAGIDTTWSAIGSSLWHLATHPEDRRRLAENPGLLDTTVEEFLRAYAPITIGRITTTETEIAGCPVGAGERVLLPWAAANRDPEEFDRADEVVIDRRRNRHLAFGLGIHRCLGSNLARMEMHVALQEFLRVFPDFALDPDHTVSWTGANVRGPKALHLRLPTRESTVR